MLIPLNCCLLQQFCLVLTKLLKELVDCPLILRNPVLVLPVRCTCQLIAQVTDAVPVFRNKDFASCPFPWFKGCRTQLLAIVNSAMVLKITPDDLR
jgi:hypothetical protein